ncbi:MAG: zinc ribbon domain-containing protein [Acidobacteriota bacterium]
MPIYEYWCPECSRKVSIFWPTIASASDRRPECPECGGGNLTKLVSRVALVRSEDARLESLADPTSLAGIDEDNPREMARWMRKMGDAMGEDLGDEFSEMVDRIEAGEDPDAVGDAAGEGEDA